MRHLQTPTTSAECSVIIRDIFMSAISSTAVLLYLSLKNSSVTQFQSSLMTLFSHIHGVVRYWNWTKALEMILATTKAPSLVRQ